LPLLQEDQIVFCDAFVLATPTLFACMFGTQLAFVTMDGLVAGAPPCSFPFEFLLNGVFALLTPDTA